MNQPKQTPRISAKTTQIKAHKLAATKASAPSTTPEAEAPTAPVLTAIHAAVTEQRVSQLDPLLAALEARARASESIPELGFSIANETYALFKFRQALVFRGSDDKPQLLTVSGLARPTENSPYLVWLRRVLPWLLDQIADQPGWFDPTDLEMPEAIQEGWQEWWTQGVLPWPIRTRSGEILGWIIFLLESPPEDWQQQALTRLSQTWGYCWEMLGGAHKGRFWRQKWQSYKRWRWITIALAIVVAAVWPIRQTVLAPAEIISLDSRVVTTPLDGVIQTIHVQPNDRVEIGDLLFSLDDTVLRNRYEVAREAVAVADAELIAASQRMFQDPSSQSEIALLTGRAHEKRAELEAIRRQFERIQVLAPESGVIVFGDRDDWLGRPVKTGERIMLLADPAVPGMRIYLPVADALALEPGAPVKLFLTTDPLRPLEGEVTQTSYQATLSPDGIASYQLRAKFEGSTEPAQARIGLQGTAKLYADKVPFGYYLLRRPLAALREWTGL